MELPLDVYLTRRSSLPAAGDSGAASPIGDYRDALATAPIPEEMPFLIDRHGGYDLRLNAFLRQLPCAGCRSPETWRAYANDIALLQRFLDGREEGHVLDATYEQLAAFKTERLHGGGETILASTFNRNLAGLEKLYDWAAQCGHVDRSPFRYAPPRGAMARLGGSRVNSLHERCDPDDRVKCLTIEEWRFFREVGLAGRLDVGGALDPAFRGGNRQRNLAIADFLLNTGVRVTEGVSILKAEVPDAKGFAGMRSMWIAPDVAKRRKGRRIMVSNQMLWDIANGYVGKDRKWAVAEGLEEAYLGLDAMTPVEATEAGRFRLRGGGELNHARLDARQRRSLYIVDAGGAILEPAMLFLNRDGTPTTAANVRAVFERASERCRRHDKSRERVRPEPFDVSPHTLRHTFAVCMLTQLIRVTLREHAVGSLLDFKKVEATKEIFRKVTFDPVDHVRRLLGHRSVETTYRYLTYIKEAEVSLQEAFKGWSSVLGAPPPAHAEEAA